MPASTRYPTGTDHEVYLTESLRGSGGDGEFSGGALPDFEDLKPLDVKNVTLVEDGEVTPLFHISRQTADHFAYSRRVVNGQLHMNFSEKHMSRHRGPLQQIRGKTMWVVLDYVDWRPQRRVKDIYRIGEVWEHAFNHEPQPHAAEQVPFSGRDLTLVGRRTAVFDGGALDDFTQGERQEIQASDLFRERKNRYLATVINVEDGDSVEVSLDTTGQTVNVRLPGVDTMEKPKSLSARKKPNPKRGEYSRWWWPSNADRPSNYSGPDTATETETDRNDNLSVGDDLPVHPSQAQLDQWGLFVRDQVRSWLPQGTKVWVVTDMGAAPQGEFGRYIFSIDPTQPLHTKINETGEEITSTNLGKHLIKLGYATPYDSDSIAVNADNLYENRSAEIDRLFREVRSNADPTSGRGVFYHPDHTEWENHLTQ